MASIHYQLGLAQAYSGKLSQAEANLQSAISILEARMSNIGKMEESDSVAMEKIDLETCIQEIKEVIVDQKDMNKRIATGNSWLFLVKFHSACFPRLYPPTCECFYFRHSWG